MKLLIFDQAMTEQVYAGRKTMARIVMDPQPVFKSHVVYAEVMENKVLDDRQRAFTFPYKSQFPLREAWRRREGGYEYRTNHPHSSDKDWQSAAMMPIAAARMWLEITVVYCERFTELHDAEFDAEGIRPMKRIGGGACYFNYIVGNYSAKTKKESLETYYHSKNKFLRPDDWAWVIHFEQMSAL